MLLETVQLQCPHCWEILELLVDTTLGNQEYTEDCSVCCHPMVVQIEIAEQLSVTAIKE